LELAPERQARQINMIPKYDLDMIKEIANVIWDKKLTSGGVDDSDGIRETCLGWEESLIKML